MGALQLPQIIGDSLQHDIVPIETGINRIKTGIHRIETGIHRVEAGVVTI